MNIFSAIHNALFGPRKYPHFAWPWVENDGDLLPDPPPKCPNPNTQTTPEPELFGDGAPTPSQQPDDQEPEILFSRRITIPPEDDPLTFDIPHTCDVRAFCNALRQGVNTVYGGNPVPFYRAAGITRSAYSRLVSYPRLHPAKRTVLAMAAALHLDLPAAEDFLRLAGYALSPAIPADVVWRRCFEQGLHDLTLIKEHLKRCPQ